MVGPSLEKIPKPVGIGVELAGCFQICPLVWYRSYGTLLA